MSEINQLAQTAYKTAIIRGKTAKDMNHLDTFFGILSELKEFREASEIDPRLQQVKLQQLISTTIWATNTKSLVM